jgi:pre-mRNA-splicing factor SPF27
MLSLTRTPDEYLADFLASRGYTEQHAQFETPLLAAGFAALSAGRPAVPASCLEAGRVAATLAPPAPDAPLDAWRGAVDQAAIQLEMQGTRQANLELLKRYGAAAWRVHNEQLQSVKASLNASVEAMRDGSAQLNRKRKAEQVAVGADLSLLDNAFLQLVHKNHQIEFACQQLQSKVEFAQTKAKARP